MTSKGGKTNETGDPAATIIITIIIILYATDINIIKEIKGDVKNQP